MIDQAGLREEFFRMKCSPQSTRRIRIFALWLICMILFNILIFHTVKAQKTEQAKADLADQAKIATGHIPSIVENELCAQIGRNLLKEKLKTLAFVLETMENPEEIKPFVDGYAKAAGIGDIVIYDREGQAVYAASGAEINENPEAMRLSLKSLYDVENQGTKVSVMTYHNYDLESFFNYEQILDKSQRMLYMNAGDQWLISANYDPSESQSYVEDYFRWTNALKKITIGESGFVMAVQNSDGTVMSFTDCREREGENVTALDVRLPGQSKAASAVELQNAFDDGTIEMEAAGKKYLAARLDIPGVLMLVLRPMQEIRDSIAEDTGRLFCLTALISGLCALYAFFHDTPVPKQKEKNRFYRNMSLAGRLRMIGVMATLLIFGFSTFLMTLSAFSDTFVLTRMKADAAVQHLQDNDEAVSQLSSWIQDEYITKCAIVKYIVENRNAEDVTREFAAGLADSLDLKYLFLTDPRGKTTVTNSDYSHYALEKDSGFQALLKGKHCVMEEPEYDDFFGENLQKVGMPLTDEQEKNKGAVLIMLDPGRQDVIRSNLQTESVFRGICMADGAVMMDVDDDGKMIVCVSESADGVFRNGLSGYDYVGHDISELGINSDRIRDEYNGNLTVLGTEYFATVSRNGDGDYIIAMQVPSKIGSDQLLPAAVCAGTILVFMILLIPVACTAGGITANETEPAHERSAKFISKRLEKFSTAFLGIFGNLTDTNKPFFKDRWPRDAIKWKNKTPDIQFVTAAKEVLIIGFLILFIRSRISGDQSIWYYCLDGKWNPGFNLYFITSSIVSISVLIFFRILLHKIFYLIARVTNARGETICQLLDSIAGYGFFIAGVFICLANFGVDTTGLSITGGIASVVFGLGAQYVVNDILSGILMTFEGTVRVGELVFFNDKVYTVLSVGLRMTRLLWFGEVTMVRNSDFKNFKCRPDNKQNRIATTLRIELDESVERIEKIMEDEFPRIHQVLLAIDPTVTGPLYTGIDSVNDDWIEMAVTCTCTSQFNLSVERALKRELKLMCERNGINIPMRKFAVHQPPAGNPDQNQ